MPTFRKIATIEARQFDPFGDANPDPGAWQRALDVMEWAGMRWAKGATPGPADGDYDAIIPTLEDGPRQQVAHYVSPGDWIAKGSHGEFYPIKPEVFATTYAEVGQAELAKGDTELARLRRIESAAQALVFHLDHTRGPGFAQRAQELREIVDGAA